MGRRPYGTGSVYEQGASWYGRWYQNGKRVKRKIGPIRQPGSRDGLTENMVGKRLQRMMLEADAIEPVAERITVQEAGERLLAHLTALGRKPTTLNAYRAALKTHLSPVIGAITLENVTPTDIERFMAHDRQAGASAKTTLNALGFLHSVFEFAQRRGWCSRNPCKLVDKPRVEKTTDIRFLTEDELEALLRATTDPRDRVMYMIAAMTGLRQGELLALRWQDVDWPAAASGSGVTTCVVSGARQRHVAAAAASRSPTASPGSWSATTSAATTGPTRISSSATRSAGRSWITASS
jgi:Phage integrase family/Phage integrase, N-terminal SAM-like domain